MAEQVATASPAGPKKKRRMGVSEGFKIEFAVDQMIAMLKAEAQSVKFKGIASFLDDKGEVVMDSIQPYLNSHLSVQTNASYPDRNGAEHDEENQTTIDDFESKYRDKFFRPGTGTASFTTSAEVCIHLYCDLVINRWGGMGVCGACPHIISSTFHEDMHRVVIWICTTAILPTAQRANGWSVFLPSF